MDWDDFPVILGQGSVHDLRDAEGSTPRLYGMRSVGQAACWALHKEPKARSRRIGFKWPKRVS